MYSGNIILNELSFNRPYKFLITYYKSIISLIYIEPFDIKLLWITWYIYKLQFTYLWCNLAMILFAEIPVVQIVFKCSNTKIDLGNKNMVFHNIQQRRMPIVLLLIIMIFHFFFSNFKSRIESFKFSSIVLNLLLYFVNLITYNYKKQNRQYLCEYKVHFISCIEPS